eukprot:scaffold48816_cov24-Tisochrysis_lutea.AAC.2
MQSSAARAATTDYAIWLEPEEEQRLRQVLRTAHEAQIDEERRRGIGGRLLRDPRKLHQLYSQMSRAGFDTQEIELCLPHLRVDASLNDALDWACLNLPDSALPSSLRMAADVEEEDEKEKERAAILKKISSQKAKPEGKFLDANKRAAAFAKQAAAKVSKGKKDETEAVGRAACKAAIAAATAAASEWKRRHAASLAESSSDDEEEVLADQFGILDLDELGDKRLEQLLKEKDGARVAAERAADESEAAGDLVAAGKQARVARRLGRHADQIETALQRLIPKYQTRLMRIGEAAHIQAKRAARRVKEEEALKAKEASAIDEDEQTLSLDFDGDADYESELNNKADIASLERKETQSGGREYESTLADTTVGAASANKVIGEEALATWLSKACAIGTADATIYSKALAADGYDSTLALTEIDDGDWPQVVKKGHRKAILRRAKEAVGATNIVTMEADAQWQIAEQAEDERAAAAEKAAAEREAAKVAAEREAAERE